jgi:hypothetical protein
MSLLHERMFPTQESKEGRKIPCIEFYVLLLWGRVLSILPFHTVLKRGIMPEKAFNQARSCEMNGLAWNDHGDSPIRPI